MDRTISVPRCLESIRRVRARTAALSSASALLLWLGVLLGAAGVLIYLDSIFRFAPAVRWLFLAVWVAVAAAATLRVLLPAFARPDPESAMLRLESCYPNLRGLLVTAVELRDEEARVRSGASTALYERVASSAEGMAGGLDPRPAVPARPYARRGGIGGLIILGTVLGSLSLHGSAGIGLQRLFAPWSGAMWPNRTRLVLEREGPYLVRRGGSLDLAGRVSGEIPEGGTMWVWSAPAEGTPYRARFRIAQNGAFQVRYQPVTADLRVRLAAGDDQSDVLEVRMVPPPEVESVELDLSYPEYSRLPAAVLPDGNATALFGTRAELRMTASKPLKAASITWNDGTGQPFTLSDPDGGSLAFTVNRDAAYTIDLVDTMGFQSDVSVTYRIGMIDNEYPKIESMKPRTDKQVTPNAKIPIQLDLTDDFALSRATLFYRLNKEATGEIDLGIESGSKRASVDYVWSLEELGLEPGAGVDYWVEVRDQGDHADVRPYPISSRLRLRVVDEATLRRRLNERADQLLARLLEIVQLQTESRDAVSGAAKGLEEGVGAEGVRASLDDVRSEEYMQKRIRSQTGRIGDLLIELADDYTISSVGRSRDVDRIRKAGELLALLAAEPMPQVVSRLRSSIDLLEDHLRKEQ